MQKTMISRVAARAAVLGVLAATLSVGIAPTVFAQNAAPKKVREKPIGLGKKQIDGIEAKLGKPLTDDQKDQIRTASEAKNDAIKAANDKWLADLSTATGISADDLKDILNPPRAPKTTTTTTTTTTPGTAPATTTTTTK